MGTIYNINKNGNLEVEHDIIRYSMPLIEFSTEDINEIEKDIKRKATLINQDPNYLTPFRVEIINSFVVYYYNVKNLKSFLYLRSFSFEEKLKYFSSLVKIAKNTDINVIWNKYNFVVDDYEENIKAILYETDLLKIYEENNVLEGIKELILISLTTLDSIVGKPRKVNFIDQDDNVLNFAETVLLKIDNLDDLEDYIETTKIHYQYDKKSKKGNSPESKEKKSLLPIKPKKKVKSKPQYRPTTKTNNTKKTKLTTKQLVMYGGLGVLLVLGIILNMSPTPSKSDDDVKAKTEDPVANEDTQSNEVNLKDMENIGETEHDEKLLLAYRYFLIDEKEKAIQVLEQVGYDKLTLQDQSILMNMYEELRLYEKVISLDEDRAERIVNNLIAENNIQGIRELQEKVKKGNPFIDFEVAYLEGDYQKVIELIDKVNLNGRKEKQIMESYIRLGNFDEAEKFANQTGNPDLVQMLKTYK